MGLSLLAWKDFAVLVFALPGFSSPDSRTGPSEIRQNKQVILTITSDLILPTLCHETPVNRGDELGKTA